MLPDYFLSLHLFSLLTLTTTTTNYDFLLFFFRFFLFVMQIVIQGLFFLLCSTPTTKRNIMGCVCLIDAVFCYTNSIHCSLICNTAPKTSKLSQMATNFVSFHFRNLLLIHKKLKKMREIFVFLAICLLWLHVHLFVLLALIYTLTSLGWLLLFFVG